MSLTPNLQDALAVQELMRQNAQQQMEATPLLRVVRGSGAGSVDVGHGSVAVPAAGSVGTLTNIPHALGLTPSFIFTSARTPNAGGFGGATIAAWGEDADSFNITVFTPSYTGGITVSFDWLAIAIRF